MKRALKIRKMFHAINKADSLETLLGGDVSVRVLFIISKLCFPRLRKLMYLDYCGHHRCAAGLFMLLPGVCLDNGLHTCGAEFFRACRGRRGIARVCSRKNIWGAQMFAQSLCIQPLMSAYITQTPAHPRALKDSLGLAEVTGVGFWNHAGWLELTLYSGSPNWIIFMERLWVWP